MSYDTKHGTECWEKEIVQNKVIKDSVSDCIFNIYTLLTIYSKTESH